MIQTEAEFERLSWHDCHIWAVDLQAGDQDKGGEITFAAIGFTQRLRAEPVLSDQQCLSRNERSRLGALAERARAP